MHVMLHSSSSVLRMIRLCDLYLEICYPHPRQGAARGVMRLHIATNAPFLADDIRALIEGFDSVLASAGSTLVL